MNHIITLPNLRWCESHGSLRIWHCTRCLWALPIINKSITVQYDDGSFKVPKRQTEKSKELANGNGKYASFFWVDKKLFMIIDTDRPTKNYKAWTKYYEDQGVAGFFIGCHRIGAKQIFDECNVSVFPFIFGTPSNIPQNTLDEAHADRLNLEQDVSVFYRGKRKHNKIARSTEWMSKVHNEIPHANVRNNDDNRLSASKYVNLMSRSKISWIPKSCVCKPYDNENVTIGRDIEAMCLESLVLRNPLKEVQRIPKSPGIHYVEYAEDSSDLIDKMRYYLEHEEERKTITRHARSYYEKYCTPSGRAQLILEDCLSVINYQSG